MSEAKFYPIPFPHKHNWYEIIDKAKMFCFSPFIVYLSYEKNTNVSSAVLKMYFLRYNQE